MRVSAQMFTEPRAYDAALADMPDWDEIERAAAAIRKWQPDPLIQRRQAKRGGV